jgi:hypothetical protein
MRSRRVNRAIPKAIQFQKNQRSGPRRLQNLSLLRAFFKIHPLSDQALQEQTQPKEAKGLEQFARKMQTKSRKNLFEQFWQYACLLL